MTQSNGRLAKAIAASITAKCKLFKHDWDGHVFGERLPDTGKLVWVARLQCKRCGSRRVDVMMPRTCELISRHYDRSDAPHYDSTMAWDEARKFLYKSMLTTSTRDDDVAAN